MTLIMIFGLGNRQKIKEDMSLSNLGTVALHAAKVPTNVFSSTLICILTLDYKKLHCERHRYIFNGILKLEVAFNIISILLLYMQEYVYTSSLISKKCCF